MAEKSSKITSKSSKVTSKSSESKNNSSGLLWSIIKLLLSQSYFVLFISIFIAFVPLKDFPFNAQSYDTPDYEKSLAPFHQQPQTAKLSYKLDDPKLTRKLFYNHPGPEAFTYDGSNIYTGLADGRIMVIDSSLTKIELFTRLSSNATAEKCDNQIHRTEECGRPLGLEVHNNRLYVIDSIDGLYSVDLMKTKQSHQIPVKAYLANVLSEEESSKDFLFNDIRFDPVKKNLCYITVSTTRYKMGQLPFSLLEHENSGLLLAIDLEHKNGSIIAKDLYFANGAEISSDDQYLYVAQSTTYSVSKLNLKQFRESIYSSKGVQPKLEPFLTDLPGEPDNLHTNNGKIYVSFALIRLNGPVISDYLAKVPIVRNFIAKSFHILSKVIYFIRQTLLENRLNYKSDLLKDLENKFYSGHIVYSGVKAKGGIAIYDENTRKLVEVIASNEFGFLSHAYIHPKTKDLLVGSFKNDFISVVKLN